MLWLGGRKWGRAGATQPLSLAHVCWEVICSKPCGWSVKIMVRGIKEAPVALSAVLCGAGRREQLRGGEGLLSTPFSCQIPSQLLGRVSQPGAEPGLVVAFPPPLLVQVFVLLFRLCLPSVSINSFPRGSGCVWLCGNGERSHSPDDGSAQGSSRAEGWIWWEGDSLLTRLLPSATSTEHRPPPKFGTCKRRSQEVSLVLQQLLLISKGSRDRFR